MAESIYYSLTAYTQEPGASQIGARIDAEDVSGAKVLSFSDRKIITLAPGAPTVDIFPTGATGLAAANLEFLIIPTYDTNSAIADRLLTFTRDAVAVEARTFAAFSCDTSLTVTNNDATYAVSIEVLAFVRSI